MTTAEKDDGKKKEATVNLRKIAQIVVACSWWPVQNNFEPFKKRHSRREEA